MPSPLHPATETKPLAHRAGPARWQAATRLVEDTFDWYAQDTAGNIWYLGEDTKEYENGEVKTTAGSWEAGVDGTQPDVIVPADPRPGLTVSGGADSEELVSFAPVE